tara:strand:+ start:887 stop:1528 length:642 start_codon:yes stop_codon:yes gene_type:complete
MAITQIQKIIINDLGSKNFKDVWNMQKILQKKRINDEIQDTLLLVEHEPVYTLGKNANQNHLLQSRNRAIKIYNTDRGGDITFHGPGQLVGYPILDLNNYIKSVSWYMRILEELIIKVIGEFGILGNRIEGLTGVWVNNQKIGAQGVRISRWVTMHGFSINVSPDLSCYDGIIPCGIFNYGVTSMKELLNKKPNIDEVKNTTVEIFNQLFDNK